MCLPAVLKMVTALTASYKLLLRALIAEYKLFTTLTHFFQLSTAKAKLKQACIKLASSHARAT